MKYNVGDKVRIKSLDWYNRNKDKNGYVDVGVLFDEEMSRWCGKTMTIIKVNQLYYTMEEDDISHFFWTDEMFECLVEEDNDHSQWTGLKVELELSKTVIDVSNVESLHGERFMSGFVKAIIPPEGYIFKDENGIVIDTHKIVLEKKKKEYPKLFVDCCAILYPNDNFQIVSQRVKGHKGDLLFHFQKLLICRDAYWMVYGEENKLGKPWEPDWESETELKYTIVIDANKVCEGQTIQVNTILAFPTEEMRDQFYNNFNIEIDICKNLL